MVNLNYLKWLRASYWALWALVALAFITTVALFVWNGELDLALTGLTVLLWIMGLYWNHRLKGVHVPASAHFDSTYWKYFSYHGRRLFWNAHFLSGREGLTSQGLFRALLPHKGVQLSLLRLGLTVDEVSAAMQQSSDISACLEAAFNFAASEHSHISWDDLWRGLVQSSTGFHTLLTAKKISVEEAIAVITWTKNQIYRKPVRLGGGFFSDLLTPNRNLNRTWTARPTPTLDRFSKNLTELAKVGLMTSAKVRDREVEEAIRILSKSQENSLILLGEPGVGKTSIVGDIALRLIRGDVPALVDYKLIALDVPAMIGAGGNTQTVFSRAIEEAASSGNVILFIGNLDQFGKAKSENGFDLSAILQSTLKNKNLQLIGTSDAVNYKKYIETNANLAPLFSRLDIQEMSAEDAVLVLEDISSEIESKLGVIITLAAIKEAVALSDRYVHNSKLPEKAKQLLDEAAVMASRARTLVVTPEHVRGVLSTKTNVPLGDLSQDEKTKLQQLEAKMHGRIIGQDEAVKAVVQALIRARVGISPTTKKPIGSFLFLGPTGVGKTELAKTLAWSYFGDETKMIRLDMSEYQTRESVHSLIGAPAVAGDLALAGGSFTEAVKATPFSVVLLDEIEKAHPDVLNLFLQVLDEGRLTDNLGNTVDFTHTIIIATSNAQSVTIQDGIRSGMSYADLTKTITAKLTEESFRPEFLNRFDGIIVFKPLTESEIAQIAQLKIDKLVKYLHESKELTLTITPEAVQKLAQLGFDPAFGARPLERVIRDRIENIIANRLLASDNLKEVTIEASDL